jgi:peptidoglycan/LPS O-acetylase OafA/YrhL
VTPDCRSARFALLDPLRALAALWVFAFHHAFSDQFRVVAPSLHRLLKEGHLGVPMFFVISGYCLTAAARQAVVKRTTAWRFLYRRARRIYPPLWLSIVVVAAIPFIIELLSASKTGRYLWPSPENVNYSFLQYGVGDWVSVATLGRVFLSANQELSQKFASINAPYWSLAIEVQFYVVVAASVACRARLVQVLVGTTMVSLAFAAWPAAYNSGIFLPWWPMFSIGVLLYWLRERNLDPAAVFGEAAKNKVAISAVVIGVTVLLSTLAAGIRWPSLVFALWIAVLIWFSSSFDQAFADLLIAKPAGVRVLAAALVLLGSMSYSIYLLHGRLQHLVAQVARQIFGTGSVAYDVAVILGTVALCYPFFRYCEAPFHRSRSATSEVSAEWAAVPAGVESARG